MGAGRPQQASPAALYGWAHHFYWELKTLAEGAHKVVVDEKKLEQLRRESVTQLSDEAMAALKRQVSNEIAARRIAKRDRADRLRQLVCDWVFDVDFAQQNREQLLARKEVKVPGEPEIIAELLSADTP